MMRKSKSEVRRHISAIKIKFLPVETHSFCKLARSLRCWSFMSSGAAHTTSDTVALVLRSHDINHLARQSHSKALPRRSLQENKREEVAKRRDKERHVSHSHDLQLDERVQVHEKVSGQELDVVVCQRPASTNIYSTQLIAGGFGRKPQ